MSLSRQSKLSLKRFGQKWEVAIRTYRQNSIHLEKFIELF